MLDNLSGPKKAI